MLAFTSEFSSVAAGLTCSPTPVEGAQSLLCLAAKWLRNLSAWIFCLLPKLLLILLVYFAWLWQQTWRHFLCRHLQAWILPSFNPVPLFIQGKTHSNAEPRGAGALKMQNGNKKQLQTLYLWDFAVMLEKQRDHSGVYRLVLGSARQNKDQQTGKNSVGDS